MCRTSPSAPFIPHLPTEGGLSAYAPSGIPEPETYGHICAGSLTTASEEYEPPIDEPYGGPGPGLSCAGTARGAPDPGLSPAGTIRGAPGLGVSRAGTGRDAPTPGAYGHIIPLESVTEPTEDAFGEEPRDAPGYGAPGEG